ncbi:MAPEG family protein [Besnoitia besnoiti]|uniref:MAPEG family protein n=1 Tax=Besnoitia besnoiti TaxID=94643 RepID=A0A2A9MCX7_BESBE|nr:MAPEG family protein [Besnoitia besnoiti]PFH36338.1 MAPEG family protein [Besnoitia besnoiti]
MKNICEAGTSMGGNKGPELPSFASPVCKHCSSRTLTCRCPCATSPGPRRVFECLATENQGPGAMYGWVIADVLLALALQVYLTVNVTRARRRFGIECPDVYAIKGVTGRTRFSGDADVMLLRLSDQECEVFNCYQRAHLNTLESYPIFLALLCLGGLQYPSACAIGGFIFLLGRLFYAFGYYTGHPEKRMWGSFGIIGLAICALSTLAFALNLATGGATASNGTVLSVFPSPSPSESTGDVDMLLPN